MVAVLLEVVTIAVKVPTIELDDQPLDLEPIVDLTAADVGVDDRRAEAGAVAEDEEVGFEL